MLAQAAPRGLRKVNASSSRARETSTVPDSPTPFRAANTCATVERPSPRVTSADTSAFSSRRSRLGGGGHFVLAGVRWKSRCRDGSSSIASHSRLRPRREGSALPNFQEGSSPKGWVPISSSRCSMHMLRPRGPCMRFMPAAVASRPQRECSSRSRKPIWSALAVWCVKGIRLDNANY